MVAEQTAKEIMSKHVENIFSDDSKQSYETLARKIINRFTQIGIVKPETQKRSSWKLLKN